MTRSASGEPMSRTMPSYEPVPTGKVARPSAALGSPSTRRIMPYSAALGAGSPAGSEGALAWRGVPIRTG